MRKQSSFLLALVLLATASVAAEQQARSFSKTITRQLQLDYLLHVPASHSEDGEPLPLILFLHGAGERGNDLEQLKRHGPPKLLANGADLEAIVVSPQCPAGSWWTDHLETLSALLDDIEASYNVDPDRIYITGLSMGGYGTWALASSEPQRFAAAIPICGGGSRISGRRLTTMPIWAFHGEADAVVPVEESREMVSAIERFGGQDVKLTTYPGVNHDSWTQTYDNPEVWSWLFSQRKTHE